MKKSIIYALLLINFVACNMVKAPEFKEISKIDLKQNQDGKLVLVAYAKFYNPNLLSGKFEMKDIQVFVNEKFLANLNAETYKVPAKKDFEVPLEVDFDKKYFRKHNILDALGSLLNNKLEVHYLGKIYYISHSIKIPYSVSKRISIVLFSFKFTFSNKFFK